ncbi:hypothetical protein K461DRAFT_297927 [Myriangium duriaei CBS 260.36]|uniref:Uncharacterized protein n=1 Tax=Myriangium duriaei CBS 260.36 TaxID=1168546 RepID=A0A9P4IRT0_9PEZI|nr:hypothetical protein K461DRAFT_297927 [Myriangium duriaei CBS 260.36]
MSKKAGDTERTSQRTKRDYDAFLDSLIDRFDRPGRQSAQVPSPTKQAMLARAAGEAGVVEQAKREYDTFIDSLKSRFRSPQKQPFRPPLSLLDLPNELLYQIWDFVLPPPPDRPRIFTYRPRLDCFGDQAPRHLIVTLPSNGMIYIGDEDMKLSIPVSELMWVNRATRNFANDWRINNGLRWEMQAGQKPLWVRQYLPRFDALYVPDQQWFMFAHYDEDKTLGKFYNARPSVRIAVLPEQLHILIATWVYLGRVRGWVEQVYVLVGGVSAEDLAAEDKHGSWEIKETGCSWVWSPETGEFEMRRGDSVTFPETLSEEKARLLFDTIHRLCDTAATTTLLPDADNQGKNGLEIVLAEAFIPRD